MEWKLIDRREEEGDELRPELITALGEYRKANRQYFDVNGRFTTAGRGVGYARRSIVVFRRGDCRIDLGRRVLRFLFINGSESLDVAAGRRVIDH